MRYLPLVLVILSGCAFDLRPLHGTWMSDTGNGDGGGSALEDVTSLGDAGVGEDVLRIADDASLGSDVGADAGSDAGPPFVETCRSSEDCCEGAYCTLGGTCVVARAACGQEDGYCCPGFRCLGGLRCVGLGIHAWEDTCEVNPGSPPSNPTGCYSPPL